MKLKFDNEIENSFKYINSNNHYFIIIDVSVLYIYIIILSGNINSCSLKATNVPILSSGNVCIHGS